MLMKNKKTCGGKPQAWKCKKIFEHPFYTDIIQREFQFVK